MRFAACADSQGVWHGGKVSWLQRSDEQRAGLLALADSRDRSEADRARAVLLTLAGWTSSKIAEAFGVREDTVRLWRSDFTAGGVAALKTSIARGPPPGKSEAALRVVTPLLEEPVADRLQLDDSPAFAPRSKRARVCASAVRNSSKASAKKKVPLAAAPTHAGKGHVRRESEVERVGLRLQLRKQQAEAGDIVLLYGDESEALTHPCLSPRAWAEVGGGLAGAGCAGAGQEGRDAGVASITSRANSSSIPARSQACSSDFIAHLEQLDRLFGPQPGRQAKPVVLVEDNGPIHTRANARSPPWPPAQYTGSPSSGCRNGRPLNSMKSSRSGAILRPITSPTRPSRTSTPSTKPSMTPSLISTASASPIRWPCQESLLRRVLTPPVASKRCDT